MFRKPVLIVCLLICISETFSQGINGSPVKQPITLSDLGNWPFVHQAKISNDGKYVIYSVEDPSMHTHTVFIHSILSSQTTNLGQVSAEITADNKFAILKTKNDSLKILTLEIGSVISIPDVSSFKAGKDSTGWLAYTIKSTQKLILLNLFTKAKKYFDSVWSYEFSGNGRNLIMQTLTDNVRSIWWENLENGKGKTVWTATSDNVSIDYLKVSNSQSVAAFIVNTKIGSSVSKSVWYYLWDKDRAIEILDEDSLHSKYNLAIDAIDSRGFTKKADVLFVTLKQMAKSKQRGLVDVWSYSDSKLQSQQIKELTPKKYLAAIQIPNGKIIRANVNDEVCISISDQYVVIQSATGSDQESFWNQSSRLTIDLISLKDGNRTELQKAIYRSSYVISPEEKYIVYYDPAVCNYFSYEIATGKRRNITSAINTKWTTYINADVLTAPYKPMGIAGWLENDNAVLLYDQHDIYQVDLFGKKMPLNLTKSYGKNHNIQFRIASSGLPVFKHNQRVIVNAFSRKNKDDGFYSIQMNNQEVPIYLTMQPYIFQGSVEDDRLTEIIPPQKASDAEIYVLRRMSAEESPNYFWTKDFKTFNRITNIHPEKKYNWLTTELVNWKTFNGTNSQGVLYKPENFDPKKKYPLIMYYYENLSEGLNGFLRPEVTAGGLNIPYYVSNGYLVFTPDIHYTIGHPGNSVVNTIVSAAMHLSKRPYVDSMHIGIQGHSRGGWETNFLVTHTNIFAAAMSACGLTDYVSLYGGVRFLATGTSRQSSFEIGFQRMGANLWQRPELYIASSPVFKADKVRTPLLMMANKEDEDIPFEQGVEFFTALRRLGKKVWMLQYDDQGHIVVGESAMDLEIRMKQFFDHYLKDSACPRWMLYGVPASQKGNPDALQLVYEKDKNGKWLTPKEGGLLNEEEKKKVEALKKRKPVTIKLN